MISDPGKTLRDFRKLHGLKQQDLAVFMHVHPGTISTWECGTVSIRTEDFIKLFDYMGYEIVIRKKKEDNHGIEENIRSH